MPNALRRLPTCLSNPGGRLIVSDRNMSQVAWLVLPVVVSARSRALSAFETWQEKREQIKPGAG